MSHLVSRILLAVLMLPSAALVYIVTFLMANRTLGFSSRGQAHFISGGCAWMFVAIFWYTLWCGAVRWTGWRVLWTLLSVLPCIVAGVLVYMFVYSIQRYTAEMVASMAAPLIWLIVVTHVWRETPLERGKRLKSVERSIICLNCGYNLTGLQSTRCPECGTQYTLDELFAGQSARAEE